MYFSKAGLPPIHPTFYSDLSSKYEKFGETPNIQEGKTQVIIICEPCQLVDMPMLTGIYVPMFLTGLVLGMCE